MKYLMIFFDADGTLFDFDRSEQHAFFAACEDLGISADSRLYRRYHDINTELWKQFERGEIDQSSLRLARFEQVFAEAGIDVDIASINHSYSFRLSQCSFLIDGALELCQKLHKTYPLAVVTNGVPEVQTPRIMQSALAPYLDHLFISGEIGWQKPHTAYFDYVFLQLGIQESDRKRTILLGDSLSSDMLGGHSAGMSTCLFSPDGSEGDETCDYKIHHLLDFLNLVMD